MLRQPLEDRKVTISRARGNYTFPTSFICIAAMNPCPCGNRGHPRKLCSCTFLQVERYRSKISGPLLDRIDMHIEVPALDYNEITTSSGGETSSEVRVRVAATRLRQTNRYGCAKTNSEISAREVQKYIKLDAACHGLLRHAVDAWGASARTCDRILKVALTIADLEGASEVEEKHLLEAINFRNVTTNQQ